MNNLGFAYLTMTREQANAILLNDGLKSAALEIVDDAGVVQIIDAIAYGTDLEAVENGAYGHDVILQIDLDQVLDIEETIAAPSEVNSGYNRLAVGCAPFTVRAEIISFKDDRMAEFEPLASVDGEDNVIFDPVMSEDELIARLDAEMPVQAAQKPVFETPYVPRKVWFAQQRAAGRVFSRRKPETAVPAAPVKRERSEAEKKFLRGYYARRAAANALSA